MAKTSKQDATGSAVGYYYQGLYAIIVLLNEDDEGVISIETGDDIQQGGAASPRLHQLKHSLGTPSRLTEKNDGLWNTISYWIEKLSTPGVTFVFVTCAEVAGDSSLRGLVKGMDGSISDAVAALEEEAKRVVAEVAHAKKMKPGEKPPYGRRLPGCRAYLDLCFDKRTELLERMTILASSPSAQEVEPIVEAALHTYRKAIRATLARRLLEWWDYRVARSLIGTAAREISKDELLDKVNEIAGMLADDSLPDDFSSVNPVSLAAEFGTNMERQVALVEGGQSRVMRAALARWRSRAQRERWLAERVGLADDLDKFDKRLIQFWADRHGPMCDDCAGATDDERILRGRDLLDWSHQSAHLEIPPLRPKWDKPFVVQGSFQELAEDLKIGWHADYLALLDPKSGKKGL